MKNSTYYEKNATTSKYNTDIKIIKLITKLTKEGKLKWKEKKDIFDRSTFIYIAKTDRPFAIKTPEEYYACKKPTKYYLKFGLDTKRNELSILNDREIIPNKNDESVFKGRDSVFEDIPGQRVSDSAIGINFCIKQQFVDVDESGIYDNSEIDKMTTPIKEFNDALKELSNAVEKMYKTSKGTQSNHEAVLSAIEDVFNED